MPLSPVIVSPSSGAYLAIMFSAILRLLTLAALALMPFGMQTGSAMAMAPADQHAQMIESGHCGEQTAKDKSGKVADKSGCAAMCTAVAVALAPPVGPHPFPRSVEQPLPQPFRHGYLAKLATPPPRRA